MLLSDVLQQPVLPFNSGSALVRAGEPSRSSGPADQHRRRRDRTVLAHDGLATRNTADRLKLIDPWDLDGSQTESTPSPGRLSPADRKLGSARPELRSVPRPGICTPGCSSLPTTPCITSRLAPTHPLINQRIARRLCRPWLPLAHQRGSMLPPCGPAGHYRDYRLQNQSRGDCTT